MTTPTRSTKDVEAELCDWIAQRATSMDDADMAGRWLQSLKADRDALLALVREAVRFYDSVRPGGRVLKSDPDIEAARSLLARIEGGGK